MNRNLKTPAGKLPREALVEIPSSAPATTTGTKAAQWEGAGFFDHFDYDEVRKHYPHVACHQFWEGGKLVSKVSGWDIENAKKDMEEPSSQNVIIPSKPLQEGRRVKKYRELTMVANWLDNRGCPS